MATTPNLGLHQWAAGDAFLRTDFNADFSKIDTAVAGRCRMICGTYTGSAPGGLVNESANSQTVSLGVTPKAVFVYHVSIGAASSGASIGVAVTGTPMTVGSYGILELVSGGFRVGSVRTGGNDFYPDLNSYLQKYIYIALV